MGLLFVAVQLSRERIIKYPDLRGRAFETLLIFMLPLIVSILIAIPGQTLRLLGIELVALGGFHWLGLIVAQGWRIKSRSVTRLDRLLRYVSPGLTTTLLTLIAGAGLMSGRVSGMYWIAAMMILALIGGVVSAWIFLVSDPDAA